MDDAALRDKLQADLQAMQSLVDQGMAYARTGHDLNEAPCPLDLEAFVDTVLADYRDAGHHLLLQVTTLPPVHTRPQALRRIIVNLVDNALKFGTQVEVSLAASTQGQVRLLVQDRGPGIPESDLPQVFQPFYRVEGSRSRDTGGTGLGLAIAVQLASGLGGRLVLSNRAEGGLQAELTLPSPPTR
jgi:signal transduction histidine kinase